MAEAEARRDVARDRLPQQVPEEQRSHLVAEGPAVRMSPCGGAVPGAS